MFSHLKWQQIKGRELVNGHFEQKLAMTLKAQTASICPDPSIRLWGQGWGLLFEFLNGHFKPIDDIVQFIVGFLFFSLIDVIQAGMFFFSDRVSQQSF